MVIPNHVFLKTMIWNSMKMYRIEKSHSSPVNIYLLEVSNKNTQKRCEIYSKLTIKTPERRRWRWSGIFIVNFEQIWHFFVVFLLFTLNR